MGWEQRNGQTYYYRKVRRGRRVASEYVGSGALGLFAALVDEEALTARAAQRAARRTERQAEQAIDGQLDQVLGAARDVTAAVLLVSGYHVHKGQWRRRNDGRQSEAGPGA